MYWVLIPKSNFVRTIGWLKVFFGGLFAFFSEATTAETQNSAVNVANQKQLVCGSEGVHKNNSLTLWLMLE